MASAPSSPALRKTSEGSPSGVTIGATALSAGEGASVIGLGDVGAGVEGAEERAPLLSISAPISLGLIRGDTDGVVDGVGCVCGTALGLINV